MACVNDFRDFVIGADPMQVEHHWQSMYVHSFYRAGPIMGSAISGIDQALWDIRGKVLGLPVYQLLGGPYDERGVRGYYHAGSPSRDELDKLRGTAVKLGIACFKTGIPKHYEWIETNAAIDRAVEHLAMLREGLGPDIDIGVDFHAKTSPAVAAQIIRAIEPLERHVQIRGLALLLPIRAPAPRALGADVAHRLLGRHPPGRRGRLVAGRRRHRQRQLLVVAHDDVHVPRLLAHPTHVAHDRRAIEQLGSLEQPRGPDLPIGQDDPVGGHDPAIELLV
jgi:hypothetical protein